MLLLLNIKCFILCVVYLKCVSAKIEVTVDAKLRTTNALGSDLGVLSDKERSSFEIDDNDLKGALRVAFGKRPDDVFVRSPTPWGDLYKTFGWAQITRNLRPTSIKTLSSSSKPIIFRSKIFKNNSTLRAEYNANIFSEEFCTVSHAWRKSSSLNSCIKLDYIIDFPIDGSGATMSKTYKNNWGNAKTLNQPVRIGSISGVKFMLSPRTKAVVTLLAEKVNMEVEINYEATLQGQAALNYGIPYKGHYFWGYEINSLFSKNNKTRSISSIENLKISYFMNPKIVVRDFESKKDIVKINTVIEVMEEFFKLTL